MADLVMFSLFSIISFLVAVISTSNTSDDIVVNRTKARTIIGRVLIIVAIVDCILSLIVSIYYYHLYHEADYSLNLFRSSIFLFVSLFAWGKHILTYSKKELPAWKKTTKAIIYIIVNLIFFVSMNWNPKDHDYDLYWLPLVFIALMLVCAFLLSKLNQTTHTHLNESAKEIAIDENEKKIKKEKIKKVVFTIILVLLVALCMCIQDGGSITVIMLVCYLPFFGILLFWYIRVR